MLPHKYQDNASQFILAAGLLHRLGFEFPGVNHRDAEFRPLVGVHDSICGSLNPLDRAPGCNQRPVAPTRVAFDFSSPKLSFPILPAFDLESPYNAKPEVSSPARAGSSPIVHTFVRR